MDPGLRRDDGGGEGCLGSATRVICVSRERSTTVFCEHLTGVRLSHRGSSRGDDRTCEVFQGVWFKFQGQ